MIKGRLAVAIGLAALGAMMACGGDDDDAGTLNPGISGSKQLGGLSEAEYKTFCMSTATFLGKNLDSRGKELGCRGEGYDAIKESKATTEAAVRTACKSAYDACMKLPYEDTTELDCNDISERPGAACMATVTEISSCFESLPKRIDTFMAMIPSCDKVTLADLARLEQDPPKFGNFEDSAECKAAQAKCSDLFEDDVP